MDTLYSPDDLALACSDDPLCMWAAQSLPAPPADGGGRAWAASRDLSGRAAAVAVACPQLSLRDRVVVWGEPDAAADLTVHALSQLGPSYRPLGDSELITGLCARLPGMTMSDSFGWMYTQPGQQLPSPLEETGLGAAGADGGRADAGGADGGRADGGGADGAGADGGRADGGGVHGSALDGGGLGEPRWLADGEMAAVTALLDRSFRDSYAWPGQPGVRRWAGIDGPDGELAAVAADAWSAPTVGFIAGVAVREDQRGAGLGSRVCRFVAGHLIAGHGRVALMVDAWNDPAIRMYRRLGLTLHEVRAAWTDPG